MVQMKRTQSQARDGKKEMLAESGGKAKHILKSTETL